MCMSLSITFSFFAPGTESHVSETIKLAQSSPDRENSGRTTKGERRKLTIEVDYTGQGSEIWRGSRVEGLCPASWAVQIKTTAPFIARQRGAFHFREDQFCGPAHTIHESENGEIEFSLREYISVEIPDSQFPKIRNIQGGWDCWAVGVTLMKGWDERAQYDIAEVMKMAGEDFAELWRHGKMASASDMEVLSRRFGMQTEPGSSRPPSEYAAMLERYGPMLAVLVVSPSAVIHHTVVIIGVKDGGTIQNSSIMLIDTTTGKAGPVSFQDFLDKYEHVVDYSVRLIHFADGFGRGRVQRQFQAEGDGKILWNHRIRILGPGGAPPDTVFPVASDVHVKIIGSVAEIEFSYNNYAYSPLPVKVIGQAIFTD